MILNEDLTYYDILDISPTASREAIQEAYHKIKATFKSGNIALYTMLNPEELTEALNKIEEAYQALSHFERKHQYDLSHGFLKPQTAPSPITQITSIDRVPPMEILPDSDSLLIPPSTDFTQIKPHPNPPTISSTSPPPLSTPKAFLAPQKPSKSFPEFRETRSPMPLLDSILLQSVEIETEWRGPFIKKLREAYSISLEEMAGITKVTKTYILAIENENYEKLPAPVYIRGFICQIAKVLKLPHEKVTKAYLSRLYLNKKNP